MFAFPFDRAVIVTFKPLGQALETRIFVNTSFDGDSEAKFIIRGDLNAETSEVPMQALRRDVGDTGNPALNSRFLYPPSNTRYQRHLNLRCITAVTRTCLTI